MTSKTKSPNRGKVRANGMLRKSIDTSWQTPEFVLERVRVFFGGAIPFDPATTPENHTKAVRYCANVPSLFAKSSMIKCAGCDSSGEVEIVCERCNGCPGDGENEPRCGRCSGSGAIRVECAECHLQRQSGLEIPWDHPWWCNPPFKEPWIRKMGQEGLRAPGPSVGLLPCNRFEEPWLRDVLDAASFVCYVDAEKFQAELPASKRRRIAFISSVDGVPVPNNPFATQILGFKCERERFLEAFGVLGGCYRIERLKVTA